MGDYYLDALTDAPDAAENIAKIAILAVNQPCVNSVEMDVIGRRANEVGKLNLSPPFLEENGRLESGQYPAAFVAAKIRRVERRYAKAIAVARSLGRDATMEQFQAAWKGIKK